MGLGIQLLCESAGGHHSIWWCFQITRLKTYKENVLYTYVRLKTFRKILIECVLPYEQWLLRWKSISKLNGMSPNWLLDFKVNTTSYWLNDAVWRGKVNRNGFKHIFWMVMGLIFQGDANSNLMVQLYSQYDFLVVFNSNILAWLYSFLWNKWGLK